MRRHRNAKIIATLGPATSSLDTIGRLFKAGADVFRLNFSHGSREDHRRRVDLLRELEAASGRPIGILLDLQGPKLRVGTFAEGHVHLDSGGHFRLDLDATPGDNTRAPLPHPEVFAALEPGNELLLDDGRLRLRVLNCDHDHADTEVLAGGELSDRKGVNVPDVVLPLSPITPKDHEDLAFGLELGVDWVALSFVQRPEDVDELRALVDGRAGLIAKLEKPMAVTHLEAIIERSDAIMVARGDLGVEMAPEQVPSVQKRILRACRQSGRPVVVATQMLDSMIHAPVPTRAEASDVAGAIYDGADAVMLSGETAVGEHPVAAVAMMNRIITHVEKDPYYRTGIDAQNPEPKPETADAICEAMRRIAHTLTVSATVTFTSSGSTSLRAARERPEAPILSITPSLATARRLALVWGSHSVQSGDIEDVAEMVDKACGIALQEGFAQPGERVVIIAGMPFGKPGTTNLLRVVRIPEDGD